MSEQYPGGFITKEPPTPQGNQANSPAYGMWNMSQQAYYQSQGLWPNAANVPDAQFNYVTMLLHGDGTSGAQNNTFLDNSTNNFTITRNGNTTQGTFSPYGDYWSTQLDTGRLVVATNTALDLTGDFTIECWVYTRTPSTVQEIINTGTGGNTAESGVNIVDSKFRFQSTGDTYYLIGTTTPQVNTWYHVAVTRSGSTSRLFVNGVQEASTTTSFTVKTGSAWNIGDRPASASSGQYPLHGGVSNVRVVKGTAVYTSNFTPSTTPLTAISGTSLLTCQSNRFIDNSSYTWTVTPAGSAAVQRFNPFGTSTAYSTATNGGSGYFDGTGDYLLPSSSTNATNFGTGDFTVELWFYTNSVSAQQNILDNLGSSQVALYIPAGGGAIYYFSSGSNRITGAAIVANQWYHIALVRSAGSTKLYLNGTQTGSSYSNTTNFAGGTTYPTIGASYANTLPINGYMSDLRIVKGTAVYTSTFTPPTEPLTAIYGTSLLLNYTNGAIYDNAMMNDLETVGNAQISTSVKKYGTGSLKFDGTGDYLSSAASPNLDMGTGDWTVECWVYVSSRTLNYPTIFGNNNGSYSAGALSIQNSNADSASYNDRFVLAAYDVATPALVASSTNSLNTWYHLAIVRNGTSLVMYRDGVSVASRTITSTIQFNWGKLGFRVGGGNWDGAQSYFNGYIDDLRITKGYARYTTTFTPPTQAFPNYGPV